ncbi:late endosomal/lysosomal adaptor and MAPK and MTOR activator-domain-containing protein [Aspergillus coremiiformis]|uniref:Ragulator complex protein LAMTOR1 n=1 Tax=Aspergillus coremiiformis TaxID=138285 RepID=A0A5N6ZI30_9EURO|nr:late endosomal/lysosomal adaptor and MAPK and MTOR activator-domain-containing protein [Aspergillus coremiiformis]
MGVCASCLGLGRRDSPESESSQRLLDDDIYQSGYGYGALNHTNQVNHPDSGYLKREREALEAICQRTSDSVIDIWSLQPQPHLQPRATLRSPVSPAPSRPATKPDVPIRIIATPPSPDAGPSAQNPDAPNPGAVPKHWGEVVIHPRKGKSLQPDDTARDVFGVLRVT